MTNTTSILTCMITDNGATYIDNDPVVKVTLMQQLFQRKKNYS